MNHLTAWPLLDHFLDGTLEVETRGAVAAHLAECATCQAYLAKQTRMHTFVRDRLRRLTLPEGLAGRVQTTIRQAEPGQALFHWPRLWPISMVMASLAVLLLLMFAWWFLSSSTPNPDWGAELATAHLLFAQDGNLLEIAGPPAAIRAWFQDKVLFPVMTPNLPGYTLLGGRVIVINKQRAAQLIYEDKRVEQYVSLIYFEAPSLEPRNLKPAGPFKAGQYGDTTIVTWSSNQARIALVTDLPGADLLPLAEQIGNK